MSKIKEYYFEEIAQGIQESKDEFADDEYQVELEEMENQLEECIEKDAEEASFENVYNLTGTYPF